MSNSPFNRSSVSNLKRKLRTECRKRVRERGENWSTTNDLSTKKCKIHLALKKLMLEDGNVPNLETENELQILSSMELEEYQEFMEKLEDEILDELNAHFTQEMNDQKETVLCPLCQDTYLVHHLGMICCPNDRFAIVNGGHDWTMETVRNTLANAFEEHQKRNCFAPLRFTTDSTEAKTFLCSTCSICSTHQPLFEIMSIPK